MGSGRHDFISGKRLTPANGWHRTPSPPGDVSDPNKETSRIGGPPGTAPPTPAGLPPHVLPDY
jgi:hypothetical protein